jgi:energy-coupling factor transport system permease protein
MPISEALDFIKSVQFDETEKIMAAQKARGADFANGSLIKRAKALIPVLIPLFVSAFRRADELATAMECRCYRGGEGRTKLHALKCRFSDIFGLIVVMLLCSVLVAFNYLNLGYTM